MHNNSIIKSIVVFCLSFIPCIIFCQTTSWNLINLVNNTNIIPPPPEAAALGRFGECPVSLFTGKANISIPLYEIQVNDFKLPINLTYNTQGNRVSDIASWVGLGWTLNAGGVITRTIKGLPDEIVYNGYSTDLENLGNAGDKVDQYFADGVCDDPVTTNNYSEILALMDISEGLMDGEPDEYYFNFNQYSGKFIIHENNVIQIMPLNNQLTLSYSTIGEQTAGKPNHIESFVITTPDGVKYYFGNEARDETVEVHTRLRLQKVSDFIQSGDASYPRSLYTGNKSSYINENLFYNSWYLYKIVLPNSGGEIQFSYETDRVNIITNFNDVYFVDKEPNLELDFNTIQRTFTESYIDTKRLKRISWDEGDILFNKNESKRIDIDRSITDPNAGYSLSSIEVNNYLNEIVHIINFETSYFTSNNSFNNSETEDCPGFFKRLRLDNVSIDDKKYSFTYDLQEMPARYSPQMDFWGFYKHMDIQNNTLNRIARPLIYVYPEDLNNAIYKGIYSIYPRSNIGNEIILPGSDRTPNLLNAQANILKKITYPTGGWDEFSYELHSFLIDGSERSGGGLRIKSITSFDGITHDNDITKLYTYSDGRILQVPDYAKHNIANSYFAENENPLVKWSRLTTIYSLGTNCQGLTQGGTVGYSEVSEKFINQVSQNSVNGIKKYYYLFPGDYLSQNDLCNVCQYFGCLYTKSMPITNTYDLSWLKYYNIGYENANYNKWDNYPFLENPDIDFARGLLAKEEWYDNDGQNIVRSKEYQYGYIHDPYILYSVKAQYYCKEHVFFSIFDDQWNRVITVEDQAFDIRWGLKKTIISNSFLKKEIETIKDLTNSTSLIKATEYLYNDRMLISQVSSTNSDGCIIKDKYKYPSDYEFTGTPTNESALGIKHLKDQNQINFPIEHVVTKSFSGNEVVTSGSLMLPKVQTPENVFPKVIMKIESTNPIPNFQLSNINSNDLSFDNNYRDFHSFDLYQEANPVLLQQHKVDDIYISYKWGYQNSYPVVKAENISYSELNQVINNLKPDFNAFLDGLGDLSSSTSKTNWKDFNNDLRSNTSLLKGLITTYTYKPLIGVTSVTDPAGYTTYFEYDSSGRLIVERDDDGNIVKKYEYHYVN
jgi:YD repeat-containing protein